MQYKVPQNVQREDHIVGPLTLKQLIICGVGGFITYGIYSSLARWYLWITWLPPVFIVAAITIAFAFIRPLDLSFGKWILRWIEFSLLPRRRIWVKGSGEVLTYTPQTGKKQTSTQSKTISKEEEKKKKLEEIHKFLEKQSIT